MNINGLTENQVKDIPQSELRDFIAEEVVGIQIGSLGHKLWICVDGECVLRVKSPKIEFTDLRIEK